MNKSLLIEIGILIWFIWGLLWVYPLKIKLKKKYGFDKNNDYFIDLAKNREPIAYLMMKRSKIFMIVGLIGAFFIVFG